GDPRIAAAQYVRTVVQAVASGHLPHGEVVRRRRRAGKLPIDDADDRPILDQEVLGHPVTLNDRQRWRGAGRHFPTEKLSTALDTPTARACAMMCASSVNHGTGSRAMRTTTEPAPASSTRYVSFIPPLVRRTSRSTPWPQTDLTTESRTRRGVVAITERSR